MAKLDLLKKRYVAGSLNTEAYKEKKKNIENDLENNGAKSFLIKRFAITIINFFTNKKSIMKKEKKILSVSKEKKSGPGSNPENKFKKGSKAASVDVIIDSAVGKTKARAGRGLANEGTTVSYEEER